MRILAVVLCTLLLSSMVSAQDTDPLAASGPGDRYFPPHFAKRSAVIAQNAMASTSHPIATQVALDVMRNGGNAIDAAIAANAVIGFLEPTGNGIGGDLFALVWSAEESQLLGLNASGRSPQGVTINQVREGIDHADVIPARHPHALTVPGAVDGWFVLHDRLGSMPMDEILQPAVEYARNGAPVPQYIAGLWARSRALAEMPGFAETFLPGGEAPKKGEIFRNPDLGNTLERIASDGRDAFYRGHVARTVQEFCEREGCYLTYDDFAAHTSDWVEPAGADFEGYTLWQIPPPGQGIAGLQMLQILKGFDLRAMGHNTADYLHHLIEAKKIAYEDRARFYADADFADVPLEWLLSEEYAEERRALLDPSRAATEVDHGDPRAGYGGTITLSTADSDGNMVALIQSNYTGFGSGFVPDGLGFVLHNRGVGFSLEDDHPNRFEPGKRPFHTIIPAFVTKDGAPYMAYGVMGGDVQPQGHVQILLNHVLFGMDVQEAGDAARFLHSGSTDPWGTWRPMDDGGCVALESGVKQEVRDELASRGHRFCEGRWQHFGGYQAVMWDAENGVYWGGTESRVDGQSAGF
jgi:gamma-glutamyltranspeptidase / glutathione hydrolase